MNITPLGVQPQGAVGIHSIDHFALAVPDLQEAERFITAFGLRIRHAHDELELRVEGNEHLWARVSKAAGQKKRLEYVSLACYASDLEALRAQVITAGGLIAPQHERAGNDGFWFTNPDGLLMQIKVAPKTMPDVKTSLRDASTSAGARAAPPRSEAPIARPARLAHLALFTSNVSRAVDFHQRALGVMVSDRARELIAFTFAPHGSDHHLLAFLKSNGPGLHHCSWDVLSIGSIGLAAERLRGAGYSHQWGLGRHVLGSNYFNYISDRWGQWWEHISDIDYIPKDTQWDGGNYDEVDGFYLWGPTVPTDFGTNTEI